MDEPGERLLIRGQVFAPDGVTPAAGVVIYLYQTGVDGTYAPAGESTPRLRGWVRTGPEGRYEVSTIRPGPYPWGGPPAHVHVLLWGAGHEPQYAEDLIFADDPRVSERQKERSAEAGRFAWVCTPGTTPEGELLCERDFRVKPQGDRISSEVAHAFQPES